MAQKESGNLSAGSANCDAMLGSWSSTILPTTPTTPPSSIEFQRERRAPRAVQATCILILQHKATIASCCLLLDLVQWLRARSAHAPIIAMALARRPDSLRITERRIRSASPDSLLDPAAPAPLSGSTEIDVACLMNGIWIPFPDRVASRGKGKLAVDSWGWQQGVPHSPSVSRWNWPGQPSRGLLKTLPCPSIRQHQCGEGDPAGGVVANVCAGGGWLLPMVPL